MKKRRSGAILMALGVILAIAVGSTMFLTARGTTGARMAQMSSVLVATQDIPERTAIQPAALSVKSLPTEVIPAGALTSADQAIGKMTTAKIFANEVVLSAKLADTKGLSGLSFTLDKGQVVVTFPASDLITTGAVRPGDSVDILITLEPKTEQNEAPIPGLPTIPTTQVTLQNLRVIAIGAVDSVPSAQGAPQPGKENNLLTFAVSHEDALVLKALKDSPHSKLEVVLRAAGDQDKVTTESVTIRDIVEKYAIK